MGESSGDMAHIASLLLQSCGLASVLDIGSGEGELVSHLLRQGVPTTGIDVSDVVIGRATSNFGPHFVKGSVLDLPFSAGAFHTIVSTDCMEHLEPSDVPLALSEMYRVAEKYVFLQLATTVDRDGHWHLTVEKRDWWERKCFEAGFRKHPAYYTLNSYESLNEDPWQIFILLEKVPQEAVEKFPLASLEAESGLHMDMSRVTGERSDAHMIRYHWSCEYVRPGDRILDAACGLGYGSRLVSHQTFAQSVHGIDGSAWAIDYARSNFSANDDKLSFETAFLPECLNRFPDGSFDVVISFETLEHVEDPQALMKEFHRILTPGGRVVVSVPNDWSDETGEDPNPYHLHVYDWDRLTRELGEDFIVEDQYRLNASQVKIKANPPYWLKASRLIAPVRPGDISDTVSEWCLMTAMKSPIQENITYREGVFSNLKGSGHTSLQYEKYYENPWLVHAMATVSYRLKNKDALSELCTSAMDKYPLDSNDYAAALCVSSYLLLDRGGSAASIDAQISKIDIWLELPLRNPMNTRWKVSLIFVKAKLLTALGDFDRAMLAYEECYSIDVEEFGQHLATKTTEAFYQAGRLAFSAGKLEVAHTHWTRGVQYGSVLLRTSPHAITMDPAFPNLYNYGDGVREYTLSWDYIGRCANGIHLLHIGKMPVRKLEGSFTAEYSVIHSDLVQSRVALNAQASSAQRLLAEVSALQSELLERTTDLVATRSVVVERTDEIVALRRELVLRTEDLVSTRNLLVERTDMLERMVAEFGYPS